MKTPKPIDLSADVPTLPENLCFFKVLTAKMDNGKRESICTNDVLFSEKSEILTTGVYVLTKKTGNKIGIIRNVDENGNFTLESNHPDKNLFPDYAYNLSMFDEVYSLVSLSRQRPIIYDATENWNDFNEVVEWQPETIEDDITYNSNIKQYLSSK